MFGTQAPSPRVGFALFDADDRLLLRNSRHAELLTDNRGVPEPGMSHEAILRRAVDRGLILELETPSDAWVEERIASSQARGSHQQRRAKRFGKFDLVLLDIMMPEMDGYGVLAEMKSDTWAPPSKLRRLIEIKERARLGAHTPVHPGGEPRRSP